MRLTINLLYIIKLVYSLLILGLKIKYKLNYGTSGTHDNPII